MGSAVSPQTVRLYFDSVAIIYFVERHPIYFPIISALNSNLPGRTTQIETSELSILETTVIPVRNGDSALLSTYDGFFQRINLIPIDRDILRKAAELRATIKALRTPDAIHAATAMLHTNDQFVTNDVGYRKIPSLPLVVLDDLRTP